VQAAKKADILLQYRSCVPSEKRLAWVWKRHLVTLEEELGE
jgi:hypothetical protein